MGDRKDLHSPLRRARLGVLTWLETIPKDIRMDAEMALDKLCEVAEREIEQAYFDGSNHRGASVTMREHRAALSSHKDAT